MQLRAKCEHVHAITDSQWAIHQLMQLRAKCEHVHAITDSQWAIHSSTN